MIVNEKFGRGALSLASRHAISDPLDIVSFFQNPSLRDHNSTVAKAIEIEITLFKRAIDKNCLYIFQI